MSLFLAEVLVVYDEVKVGIRVSVHLLGLFGELVGVEVVHWAKFRAGVDVQNFALLVKLYAWLGEERALLEELAQLGRWRLGSAYNLFLLDDCELLLISHLVKVIKILSPPVQLGSGLALACHIG